MLSGFRKKSCSSGAPGLQTRSPGIHYPEAAEEMARQIYPDIFK